MKTHVLILAASLVGSVGAFAQNTNGQDNASPENGISYTVSDGYDAVQNDAYDTRCQGKHPPGANYHFETRHYTEYKDGKAVRVWTESVKIFMSCVGG